ncbi:hypothetical protein PsorP6_011808 [Peronosclerospora sorghi]|uniref:Uncharacterized protein n=1 Tax=Peronosclerospora sorghi TaxID=230839 RepID=A0ACC0WJ90_9STRA|nr:hypothetical protein PsorP6_011808 [Peronosclerospora sorghi]
MMAKPVAVCDRLQDPYLTLSGYGVCADSAFTVSGDMTDRIVTPLKDGDLRRAVSRGGDVYEIEASNVAVTSIRQAAEWGMGAPIKRQEARLTNTAKNHGHHLELHLPLMGPLLPALLSHALLATEVFFALLNSLLEL